MERGFGFIRNPDGGNDIFVHFKALLQGARWIEPGDEVEFNVEKTEKGLRATEVTITSVTPGEIAERNSRAVITHPNPRYKGPGQSTR